MTTRTAILIGLVCYACLMVAVSVYWMLRVKKAADYLVAGRGLPWWIIVGTTVGTCIGTGVVIGASGLAYRYGWAGSAYPFGLGLGTLLVGFLYAVTRRYKFMTLIEEIACYYGGNELITQIANVSLFVSQLCWLTVQIMGGGNVLAVCTNMDPKLGMVLSGLITMVISVPGGLRTVVYTDFVQAMILLCGFGMLTGFALADSGGMAGLEKAVPAPYFSFMGHAAYGGWQVISLILVLVLSVLADPGRRLTMYSAASEAGARWGLVGAGIITACFSVVVGICGMYVFKLNPNLPKPDQAMPWLVMKVLPPWLAAVVVVAIVSAIFSSANGCAAAVGGFFVRHIYPLVTGRFLREPIVAVRRVLVATFVVSTAIALFTGSIVGFVVKFLPLTMSGLAVIIILGRFWKRAVWQGAVAALIVTPAVALVIMFIPAQARMWGSPIIPATLAGIIAHILVSLLSPAQERGFDEVAEALSHERQAVEDAGSKGEGTGEFPGPAETAETATSKSPYEAIAREPARPSPKPQNDKSSLT